MLVLTDSSTLETGGKSLPIIPGMLASMEIRTGEKTILDYLLKPIVPNELAALIARLLEKSRKKRSPKR